MRHPQLIAPTRQRLLALGLPYVLENVVQAAMRTDALLCGLQFGLPVFRHRLFEVEGWTVTQPEHPVGFHRGHRVSGWRHGVRYEGDMLAIYGDGGGKATVDECRRGLGIDWSHDRRQLVEAIPPAYTEFLGRQLLAQLKEVTMTSPAEPDPTPLGPPDPANDPICPPV